MAQLNGSESGESRRMIKVLTLDDTGRKAGIDIVQVYMNPHDAYKWAKEIVEAAGYKVTGHLEENQDEWWSWDEPLFLYMRAAMASLNPNTDGTVLQLELPDSHKPDEL